MCTSGTAAANFHPAVIEADESAVPLLVLTADRPPELRGTGASQTIDQVKLYGSAVRWYAEAGVPERCPGMAGYWRSLACRAWAHAAGDLGTLPGPVHLNIPLRDPLVPDGPTLRRARRPAIPGLQRASARRSAISRPGRSASESGFAAPTGRSRWTGGRTARRGRGSAAGAVVAEPLELPWAERGVVVCGDGDYDAAALVELAEQAGWPVLAEPSSGARRGPNALTGYQYLLASPEFMAAHRPTVIVSAGRPGLTRPQSALLRLARTDAAGPDSGRHHVGRRRASAEAARRRRSAHRDPAGPGMWADPQRAATDVAAAVRLTGAPDRASSAAGPAAGRWLADWRGADAAATKAATAVLDAWPDGELSEPEVARELVAALPADALLWCGNSLSVRDIDLALPPRADMRVMASRGASGIDGTFSTAAGAALAHAADHPGAVAFALDRGPVPAARRARALDRARRAPARPVRDRGQQRRRRDLRGARARRGSQSRASRPALTVFERTFGTPHGASIEHLAAAFGIPYTLAERPGEIAKAVAATVPGSGPRIVEARTGRAPNADLRARMSAAALAALDRSL